MSDAAAERVRKFMENRGKGLGPALGVENDRLLRSCLCAGVCRCPRRRRPGVRRKKGITVIVDGKSMVYLDGTELDFVREGLNEGFTFKNPNVKDECGCGESFTV